jgi:hypothetical protein
LKSGACCLLRGACRLLFAACCPLHAACCLEVVCCTLRVVRCIFPVACCMSSVAFSVMHVACCQLSVAHFPVRVCGTLSVGSCLLALSLLHVAHSPLSVFFFSDARPSVPCRMVSAVRRLSHVASGHVTRCMTHALCRMLSLVRCLSRLARRLLHVVCCVLQSDTACCRVTRSRRARSASQRRLQFRAQ